MLGQNDARTPETEARSQGITGNRLVMNQLPGVDLERSGLRYVGRELAKKLKGAKHRKCE